MPQAKTSSPAGSNPQPSPAKRTSGETASGSGTMSSFAGTAVKPALENTKPELSTNSAPLLAGAPASQELPARSTSNIEQIKTALETRRKMLLVTVLEAASSITLAAQELCIEFSQEGRHFRDTLAKSDNVKVLRDVCHEITGCEVGVRIVIQDRETNNAPTSKEEEERRQKQLLRESAEKNPVVQKMLRTFRGEIVDVRRLDQE
jgi:hypothetical protein